MNIYTGKIISKVVGDAMREESEEELLNLDDGRLSGGDTSAMGYYLTHPNLKVRLCRMPSVCTARIIAGLGKAENTYGQCEHYSSASLMTKEIKSWINYCEENEQLAYLMATTSNDQVAGAEALEAAGFICTHNVVNQKYPNTYLKTWMYFFNGEVTPEQLEEFGE